MSDSKSKGIAAQDMYDAYNNIYLPMGNSKKEPLPFDLSQAELDIVFGGKFIIDEIAPAMECNHEPIDVGFHQSKLVCKKCDKDL